MLKLTIDPATFRIEETEDEFFAKYGVTVSQLADMIEGNGAIPYEFDYPNAYDYAIKVLDE